MTKADVSLQKAPARVQFDEAKLSLDKFLSVIDQLGFSAKLVATRTFKLRMALRERPRA